MLPLLACSDKLEPRDSAETAVKETAPESDESGESAETSADSDPPPDTGTIGLRYAATLEIVGGRATTGTGGASWRGDGGAIDGPLRCTLLGGWVEAPAPKTPCVDCDYAFAVALDAPELAGDGCAALGVEAATLDGWIPGWGWAPQAEVEPGVVVDDVLFAWYPAPYAAWYPVAWAEVAPVAGSADRLSFDIPSGLYYYLPAP